LAAGAFLGAALVATDAAGLGVAAVVGAVLAAGFWPQPLAINAIALKKNKNFFIDPPIEGLFWKSSLKVIKRLLAGVLLNCRGNLRNQNCRASPL
jgi:hypothetical protein